MSVLVTGASGFMGLNLVERLLADGETVVGLSATRIAPAVLDGLSRLPGLLIEEIGDVRDRASVEALLRGHGVDRVAHLAAITASADRERSAADEVLAVNLAGLAAVMTAAANAGVRRFVYAGSIAVYGNEPADGSLITEDTPHAPKTLYAITKSTGEAVTARLGALHGLDWVIGRLGRVFGPHEHDTGVRDLLSQIHQVTALAVDGRTAAFDRPCLKNWNFAPDSAAHLQTLLDTPGHAHPVYNLGSEHAWTLDDWCAKLVERLPAFAYRVGPAEPGEDAVRIDLVGDRDGGLLSWQRFADEFRPAPGTGFDAAFDRTLARWSAPSDGVDAAFDRTAVQWPASSSHDADPRATSPT